VAGIPAAELNQLELLMLKELDYRLCVGEEEVAHSLRQLKVLARMLPRRMHDCGQHAPAPSCQRGAAMRTEAK
jgi:hypothetical protein